MRIAEVFKTSGKGFACAHPCVVDPVCQALSRCSPFTYVSASCENVQCANSLNRTLCRILPQHRPKTYACSLVVGSGCAHIATRLCVLGECSAPLHGGATNTSHIWVSLRPSGGLSSQSFPSVSPYLVWTNARVRQMTRQLWCCEALPSQVHLTRCSPMSNSECPCQGPAPICRFDVNSAFALTLQVSCASHIVTTLERTFAIRFSHISRDMVVSPTTPIRGPRCNAMLSRHSEFVVAAAFLGCTLDTTMWRYAQLKEARNPLMGQARIRPNTAGSRLQKSRARRQR